MVWQAFSKMVNQGLLTKQVILLFQYNMMIPCHIPLQYDNAFGFSKGLAIVWPDGESFYINQQGQKLD